MLPIEQLLPTLGIGAPILILLLVWTLVWKGIALWKAAKSDSKIWFIVFMIINTVGILEILYVFFFSKMGKKDQMPSVNQ